MLREEKESDAIRSIIQTESVFIVSSLAELEVEIEIKASYLGGEIRLSQYRHFLARFAAMRNFDPFHFQNLPSSVFATAIHQNSLPHGGH